MSGRRADEEFLELAMPHADMLHTLARRLTPGREEAEDLVQEVFLRAYSAWRRQAPPRSMGAWLATICLNTWRSSGRRRQARPLECHDDAALGELREPSETEVLALARVDAATVNAAMGRLSEGQREVVTMVNLCGFSTGEVARMLDLPRGTVLSRLHRGHQSLAVHLVDRVSR